SLTPVQHTYTAPGKYKVTLIVSDGSTDSDAATTTADVLAPARPDQVAVVPRCGDPGTDVRISGIVSSASPQRFGGVNLANASLSLNPVQVQDFTQTHTLNVSSSDLSFDIASTAPA